MEPQPSIQHPGLSRLRQEATMGLKRIAQRLQMGSWTYVSNLLNARSFAEAAQPALSLLQ
jgi:hypothetical protein